jgi:hypothetical protein
MTDGDCIVCDTGKLDKYVLELFAEEYNDAGADADADGAAEVDAGDGADEV